MDIETQFQCQHLCSTFAISREGVDGRFVCRADPSVAGCEVVFMVSRLHVAQFELLYFLPSRASAVTAAVHSNLAYGKHVSRQVAVAPAGHVLYDNPDSSTMFWFGLQSASFSGFQRLANNIPIETSVYIPYSDGASVGGVVDRTNYRDPDRVGLRLQVSVTIPGFLWEYELVGSVLESIIRVVVNVGSLGATLFSCCLIVANVFQAFHKTEQGRKVSHALKVTRSAVGSPRHTQMASLQLSGVTLDLKQLDPTQAQTRQSEDTDREALGLVRRRNKEDVAPTLDQHHSGHTHVDAHSLIGSETVNLHVGTAQ
jgi:hypothetical protein